MMDDIDVNPVGQTVAAVIAQAQQWGMGAEKKDWYNEPDHQTIPKSLPTDWIVPDDPKLDED
jgi:hypothetical protein